MRNSPLAFRTFWPPTREKRLTSAEHAAEGPNPFCHDWANGLWLIASTTTLPVLSESSATRLIVSQTGPATVPLAHPLLTTVSTRSVSSIEGWKGRNCFFAFMLWALSHPAGVKTASEGI